MSNLLPILARQDDSTSVTVKLVLFGILLVVWAIGAVAKKLKTLGASRPAKVARPPLPPPVPLAKAKPKPKKKAKAPRGRPPAVPPLPGRVVSVLARDLAAPTTAAAAPARPSVTARDVRGWLTPQVMRSQYILTEIFEPPPGVREREGPLG